MSAMPNAQGIMGLMSQGRAPQGAPQGAPQRPPQGAAPQGAPQQPMPSPMKASPMAGLGSVEDRVAAYRGNPAPLQQRYSMSQDMLDLLALQKIKSEKESAMRQMQLAMGQQQAAQGMEPETIAKQREKEVMELTKNELAQQRGETAQKQTADQQSALQRAMSGGVASAPGAASAAQPKMMAAASGGIVGYAGGGAVAFDKGGAVDSARARARAAREKVQSYGTLEQRRDPEGYQAAQQALQEAQAALQEAESGYAGEMSAAGVDRPAFSRADVGGVKGAMGLGAIAPQAAPMPAAGPRPAPTAGSGSVSEAQATAAAGPQAAAPVPAPAAPPAPPRPAPAPGIAGLPQAGGAPAQGMPSDGRALNALMMKQAQRDDRAEGLAEEGRVEGRLAPPEEQLRAIREANEFRKREFDTQYDPERQRQEGLKRFLIGAGGRRYGELGGGAAAGMAYDASQRGAKLKEFDDMQKGIMQPFDLKRAATKEGIGAGQNAAKIAGENVRSGISGLANQYGTDVGSRDKALDRAVDQLKINLQSETNQIQREGLDLSKAQSVYSAATGRVQELERKLDQDFAKQYGMLLMSEQSGKMEPAQKQQLEVARTQLEIKKDQIRKELEPVLASARQKLGIPNTGAYKVTEITPGKK